MDAGRVRRLISGGLREDAGALRQESLRLTRPRRFG
jgi:hypothetical protein